jgi:hypothetical protein
MMTSMFLDQEEIKSLTNSTRRDAQTKALRAMGIEHKVRPDGSVAILRDHINKVFDGNPDSVKKRVKVVEPNWDAI